MASSSSTARPPFLGEAHSEPASGDLLSPSSFTALRLRQCTPVHMHLTSRTLFIGPIPRGWTQRKDDGKDQFLWDIKERSGLSRKTLTFSAEGSVGRMRRVSGLEVQRTNEGGRENVAEDTQRESLHHKKDAGMVLSETSPVEAERKSRSRTRKSATLPPGTAKGLRIISPDPETSSVALVENEMENGNADEGVETSHLGIPPELKKDRSPSPNSFAGAQMVRQSSVKTSLSAERQGLSTQDTNTISGPSTTQSPLVGPSDSTTRLLPGIKIPPKAPSIKIEPPAESSEQDGQTRIMDKITRSRSKSNASQKLAQQNTEDAAENLMPRLRSHIRFDLTNQATRSALLMRAQMAQSELGTKVRSFFHTGEVKQGEILKMEKMLVREDVTSQKKLPDDFDENTSQGVVSSTLQKWREFMIVCRKSEKIEGARYVLQAYKTRAIPALEDNVTVHPELEIPIERKMMNFNMYSSLDKTLVFWISDVQKTHIYILQSHSSANSVEWFTLIRSLMGYERPTELTISVPDINVSLHLEDPFSVLRLDKDADEEDETALFDSLAKEEYVADAIIERCVNMLQKSDEWADILREWLHGHRIGLAWKRYDRLEWVSGINEKKMFGTIAMIRTHDLELRPKEHYPTKAITQKGKVLTEPPPVEGFLILRTLQNGTHHRLGRAYSRRLYFATFDHYLVYTRPRNARPPPPPPQSTNNTNGGTSEVPIVYAVTPYPIVDEKIEWLNETNAKDAKSRDEFAAEEAKRRYHILSNAEGFIDLTEVIKVRKLKKKHLQAEEVTIMPEEISSEDEEVESEVADNSKTIELILRNGLTLRLQAYDDEMRMEWRNRLRALVKYWRWRQKMDLGLLRQVRDENLEELQIDEEGEAWVGQFARKWELTQTYASPEMYNVCGLSYCRTILMAGPLYRKPRMRGDFTLVHCILAPGALLIYQNVLRRRTGKLIPHVLREREQKIDLQGCYLYSGLLTENELLYRNRTFDANSPGHHALPRIWPEEGWNNFDEDVMTCFVLWRPSGKSWFRDDGSESGQTKFRRVSALGKTGNRMVFRARSRAERDQWVLAIAAEIERLQSQGKEEVRIVESKS